MSLLLVAAVVVLLLLVLSGVFAMTELAVVSARKNRLCILAAEGSAGARAALALAAAPNRFLPTVQISTIGRRIDKVRVSHVRNPL